jgi:hypothetical protein
MPDRNARWLGLDKLARPQISLSYSAGIRRTEVLQDNAGEGCLHAELLPKIRPLSKMGTNTAKMLLVSVVSAKNGSG